jgi:hypothetical protein
MKYFFSIKLIAMKFVNQISRCHNGFKSKIKYDPNMNLNKWLNISLIKDYIVVDKYDNVIVYE